MSTTNTHAILSGLLAAGLLASGVARAADAAAPAAPPQAAAAQPGPMTGPLVAGICLLSRQDIVGRSKVGAAASARVLELQHNAQTEFDGEKAHLEARAAALRSKRPTSAAMQAQMQAQAQALNQQAQQMQERAGLRSRQLEATHNLAVNHVLAAAQPFVEQAFAAHNCGLLFDKDVAIGGNLGNDLTPEAIAAMDAKAAPITVELAPAASVGR